MVASFSRTLLIAVVMVAVLGAAGCKKAPNPDEARKLLVGQWRLVVMSDCQDWGIDSDTLTLHSDGRMEQHLKLLNGKKYDSAQERWEYFPDHSISLDRRLIVSDLQNAGIPESEVLILEFGDPPAILLNPDENCFYERFSSDERPHRSP